MRTLTRSNGLDTELTTPKIIPAKSLVENGVLLGSFAPSTPFNGSYNPNLITEITYSKARAAEIPLPKALTPSL
jgi:hypothetical protein